MCKNLLMIKIDTITFECFVVTIPIIDNKVWIITKLCKRLEDTEQTVFLAFNYYQIYWKVYLECLVPVFDKQDKAKANKTYFYF